MYLIYVFIIQKEYTCIIEYVRLTTIYYGINFIR